jgi:hypothetical protein
VDGHVFAECWLLVREQAVEATKYLPVKRQSRLKKNSTHTRMSAEAANSGDAV